MTNIVSLLLTFAVLAAFALLIGGVVLLRRGAAHRLKGGLMVVASMITLLNVYSFATFPG
jgi:hypothetical protein